MIDNGPATDKFPKTVFPPLETLAKPSVFPSKYKSLPELMSTDSAARTKLNLPESVISIIEPVSATVPLK